MRILIIAEEEWNDYVFANNVLTNWFSGFNAEFAEIYTSPGLPINNICNKYFQITDKDMVKSIISFKKAGKRVLKPSNNIDIDSAKINANRVGIYGFFKKLSLKMHTLVMIIRDFIWMNGHYNTKELKLFIQEFNPDVVFCPRYISPKMMRLENLVYNMTNAPFVAFTGDYEVYLPPFSLSISWFRKWYINKMFKKHSKIYSHYLMHSKDQAIEYTQKFNLRTSTFYKCGDFTTHIDKKIGKPIRLVYAGRLYCNRWKSLAEIGIALQKINKNGVKMILDIYTQDKPNKEQFSALSEDKFIYLKGCVTPSELHDIYLNADIALHVESMDNYNRIITQFSFSTKLIDLMASTCAIMAICWEKHCGFQYLKEKDAAFCISDYKDIYPKLKEICDNPKLIQIYSQKAFDCGKKNHNRYNVQKKLYHIFESTIKNN